jgi:hypothetical protein
MPDRDAFDDRRRALEEGYFHRKEAELIEQMRRRVVEQKERADISEASGIVDEEALRSLQELGFTRDTVMLMHLIPLVRVAWSDGKVTSRERDLILEAAVAHGVAEGSPAREKLESWFERRPSEDLFDAALRIVKVLREAQSEIEGTTPTDLVALCTQVANASGGILGFGRRISRDESAVIERIASELAASKSEAANKVVDEI